MSSVEVLDWLTNHLVQPLFAQIPPSLIAQWETLGGNPRILAAVCILLGATLTGVGARLLLFATLLMLVAPTIAGISYITALIDTGPDATQHVTNILYVAGVIFGGIGLLEGTLKLMFGRQAGAFAFASVLGVVFGSVFNFVLLRRR
jgi:hypothetical protein